MDSITIGSLLTVVVFGLFIAIWIWSWRKDRKPGFERMANLPLEQNELKDIKEESL